ncbi:hypothetical protein BC826DRAFT_1034967 [Russula brevipes]|nr:hypothetical protein BC826DRAFT_1034967 [Russula brevipes]
MDPSPVPGQNQNQDQAHSGGMLERSSATKSAAMRIYAPRPFTPPAGNPQGPVPVMGLPGPGFKTPTFPFAKSVDEAADAAGQGEVDIGARSSAASTLDTQAVAPNLFRPMSCRPQDENGAQARQRPSSHQSSFFGGARFSFDSVASNLDDSGYYSSMSEQHDNEAGDHQLAPAKRNAAVRRPLAAAGDTAPEAEARSTKRIRPISPGEREGMVLDAHSHEISKRPRVHRGPLRSRDSLPAPTAFGNVSPGGSQQTFTLPPDVPHPTATIGDLLGLEFSEADLERYAELFTEMMDMIKKHMSSKVNLYKSLQTKLADERGSLEQRAKELRDAGQALVRDSGSIGGGLDSETLLDTRSTDR